MSNEEIYEELNKEYSEYELIPFCEILADMYGILWKEEQKNNRFEPVEFGYDEIWWREKYKKLTKGVI